MLAGTCDGAVPTGEFAVRIAAATIKCASFLGLPLGEMTGATLQRTGKTGGER